MGKEKLFPFGAWATGLQTFLLKTEEKYVKAMKQAYKKYCTNGFELGIGVEAYKKAHTEKMYSPKREVSIPGYLYASNPTLRISDENELRMFNVSEVAHSIIE